MQANILLSVSCHSFQRALQEPNFIFSNLYPHFVFITNLKGLSSRAKNKHVRCRQTKLFRENSITKLGGIGHEASKFKTTPYSVHPLILSDAQKIWCNSWREFLVVFKCFQVTSWLLSQWHHKRYHPQLGEHGLGNPQRLVGWKSAHGRDFFTSTFSKLSWAEPFLVTRINQTNMTFLDSELSLSPV